MVLRSLLFLRGQTAGGEASASNNSSSSKGGSTHRNYYAKSVSKEDLPRLLQHTPAASSVSGGHNAAAARGTVMCYILFWYLASLLTLVLNKIILSELGATSQQLGLVQMVSTALFGALKVWSSGGFTVCTSSSRGGSSSVGETTSSPRHAMPSGSDGVVVSGGSSSSSSADHATRGSSASASPSKGPLGKTVNKTPPYHHHHGGGHYQKRSASDDPTGEVKAQSASAARSAGASSESPLARDLRSTLGALAALRSVSVLLGLVSLKHVPASFTETIKSTAPLFTVYMQHAVLGMRTSPQVLASLLPVMAGLVICAQAEVAFNVIGFWAAVFNNVVDCLQNVVSKKVLARVSPVRLQFYTSVLALVLQVPIVLWQELQAGERLTVALAGGGGGGPITETTHATQDGVIVHGAESVQPRAVFGGLFGASSSGAAAMGRETHAVGTSSGAAMLPGDHRHHSFYYAYFFANVCTYHAQSISAYYVVAHLTPVSMSVANTLKRSLLIALSVAYFGNSLTLNSVLGVCVVIAGVCGYNRARLLYPPPPAVPAASTSSSSSSSSSSRVAAVAPAPLFEEAKPGPGTGSTVKNVAGAPSPVMKSGSSSGNNAAGPRRDADHLGALSGGGGAVARATNGHHHHHLGGLGPSVVCSVPPSVDALSPASRLPPESHSVGLPGAPLHVRDAYAAEYAGAAYFDSLHDKVAPGTAKIKGSAFATNVNTEVPAIVVAGAASSRAAHASDRFHVRSRSLSSTA